MSKFYYPNVPLHHINEQVATGIEHVIARVHYFQNSPGATSLTVTGGPSPSDKYKC